MFLISAAALVAATTPNAPRPAAVAVQARATVRIISAARVRFQDGGSIKDQPPVRSAVIRTRDGPQSAKLIEFE